jgi:hypothetical protein
MQASGWIGCAQQQQIACYEHGGEPELKDGGHDRCDGYFSRHLFVWLGRTTRACPTAAAGVGAKPQHAPRPAAREAGSQFYPQVSSRAFTAQLTVLRASL